jgi:hypothetical protein
MTQPSSVQYYPGYSQQQVQQNYLTQTISAISNSNPMIVTTKNPHNYLAGINVSFLVPVQYGMGPLNVLNGEILSVTSNTLTIAIDSTMFSAFAYPNPLPNAYTPASVVPNASSYALASQPPQLPFGNQDTFNGAIYNNGAPGDPVNGA